VFLALEGLQEVTLPTSIRQVLRLSGLTGRTYYPLQPSEIRSMVSGADFEIEAFNNLTYKSKWPRDLGDPFDSFSTPSEDAEPDAALGERYEKLLYWLTATAEGTWNTFAQACYSLDLLGEYTPARRILRRFMLLGHVECSADGKHWTVCPPTLVCEPNNTKATFLCGARTPALLDEITKRWDIEETSQPNYEGPRRVRVSSDDMPLDGEIELNKSRAVVVAGNSSMKLAHALPDLERWMDTLACVDRLSTTHFEIESWNGKEYVPCYDCIEKDNQYVGKSGLYRLTRAEGDLSYSINLYLDQEGQRWLKGDWYGLRYLALHAAGAECKAVRDKVHGVLMIPASSHLPMLYERAVVLATGRLPTNSNDYEWLKYEGVTDELAQMLIAKLNFRIEERTHV
jgi:hypothetical protein